MKAIILALVLMSSPALALEAGWHYSPLAGEGDRAAMGCEYGSDETAYACLVVRCEDDFRVGLHIHTSGPGDDAGRWSLDIDDETTLLVAQAGPAPYHVEVQGEVAPLIEAMKNGAVAYLQRPDGSNSHAISLSGSLYVINQALYFCAPKVAPTP